jgi:hypothetical protein
VTRKNLHLNEPDFFVLIFVFFFTNAKAKGKENNKKTKLAGKAPSKHQTKEDSAYPMTETPI